MSTKKEILDNYRVLREKYKDQPEILARAQAMVKEKLNSLETKTPDQQRIEEVGREAWAKEQNEAMNQQIVSDRTAAVKEENPILSAAFPNTATAIGKGDVDIEPFANPSSMSGQSIIDVGTLPARSYIAAFDAAGGDVPFSESIALTESDSTVTDPGLLSYMEDAFRGDPTMFIPGAAGVKGAKYLPRIGQAIGQELFLEGGKQLANKDLDIGSLGLATAAPIGLDAAGKVLKGIGGGLANLRYGDQGSELLEEGLVGFTGSPKAKLESEIATNVKDRTTQVTGADTYTLDKNQEVIDDIRSSGIYEDTELDELVFKATTQKTTELGNTVNSKLNDLYNQGIIRQSELDKAKQLVADEINELEGFGSNKLPLTNRADKWLNEATKNTPRGIASKLLYDNSKEILANVGGEASDRLKTLNRFDSKNITDAPINTLSVLGAGNKALNIPAAMTTIAGMGNLAPSYTRPVTEFSTEVYKAGMQNSNEKTNQSTSELKAAGQSKINTIADMFRTGSK